MKPFIVSFLLWGNIATGQIVKGIITDSATNKPVPYVGIGILHKAIGTVSNNDGTFMIDVSGAIQSDTLQFSEIGYSNADFIITKVNHDTTEYSVRLKPETEVLDSVRIVPKGNKQTEIIGNTFENGPIMAGFSTRTPGTEIGTVLKYREDSPGLIESLNFNLIYNGYDSILLEINIRAFHDGVIGESILKHPMIVTPPNKRGTFTVDVKDSSIIIKQDVFLSLEVIRFSRKDFLANSSMDRLLFAAGIFGSSTYYRKSAQDTWEKAMAFIGAGFWAKVSYYQTDK